MGEKLIISSAVKTFVTQLKAQGKDKRFIDTDDEYNKLKEYLNGSESEKFTDNDKIYVKGLMIESAAKLDADSYASKAMDAVNSWDDDTNKSEFDKLFGTSEKAGEIDADNIIETLASFSNLQDFVDGVEDQDSGDNKASMERICTLINDRIEKYVDGGVLSTDSSRYLHSIEALNKINEVLADGFSRYDENTIANMLTVIVRELSGVSLYNGITIESKNVDIYSGSSVALHSSKSDDVEYAEMIAGLVDSDDDDSSKMWFDNFFGDGTINNPGVVYAGNIVEILDNIVDLQEFIEDIEDQDSGDNINSMMRIVTLLEERLALVLETGIIDKNHSYYQESRKCIDSIKEYVKAGLDGNETNIANEIHTFISYIRGIGSSADVWRADDPKELAKRALNAVDCWWDDNNKREFDYLFGTGSATARNAINFVNIVDVLDTMSSSQMNDFVNGIEDQDEGQNTDSMKRIVDLLRGHLELLVKDKKIDNNSGAYSRITDKFDDIETYMNNGFWSNEEYIASTLMSIVSQLKAVNKK